MQRMQLNNKFSVSAQVSETDIEKLKNEGVQMVICNRPDGEEPNQISIAQIQKAAENTGLEFHALPFASGAMPEEHVSALKELLKADKSIHAYCRTGNRSTQLWKAATAQHDDQKDQSNQGSKYDVVIVGAGSAGIATAASLLKRLASLRIVLIDPSQDHFYQPGWTMVGGGVFDVETTKRKTSDLIPSGCRLIRGAVTRFLPKLNKVELDCGDQIYYRQLIVAPGLKIDWAGIEGLEAALGRNGVTSNYHYDLAPYTWELVQNMQSGKALFTQPPMPIKCAGAPQKAMYLSASEWYQRGKINNIDIEFHNAGGVLFGVQEYVPALTKYVEKYNAKLCFGSTLVKVDGDNKRAWFKDGEGKITEQTFDFLHVCPPQTAPDFIRESELADESGWLDVDPATLQSKKYENIWGVGDVMNTPNAKTMAAARKQAPVVAHNVAAVFEGETKFATYDGYGSCPLTVEHGKIVLAEFTYGGKVSPSFPSWINDGTQATSFAWHLKTKLLPSIYWHGMLKGREWLASPSA